MPQLNVLSVDVTQSTDYKADISSSSTKDQNSDERFSEMVNRHLENEKSKGNGNKQQETEEYGNKTSNKSQEVKVEDGIVKILSQEKSGSVEVEVKSTLGKAVLNVKIQTTENGDTKYIDDTVSQAELNNSSEEIEAVDIKEQSVFDETNQVNPVKPQESSSELKKSEFFISLVNSAQQILQGEPKADEGKLDEPTVAESKLNELKLGELKLSEPKQEASAKKTIETTMKGELPEGEKTLVVEGKSVEKVSQKITNEQLSTIDNKSDRTKDKVKSDDSIVNNKAVDNSGLIDNNTAKVDSSIVEKTVNKISNQTSNSDYKNQSVIQDTAINKISAKTEVDTGIKINEQIGANEKALINQLTSENVDEKINLSSLDQVTKPGLKIDGNLSDKTSKQVVSINASISKNSELPSIDVLANAVNEKMATKELMENAEVIQSVNAQSKSQSAIQSSLPSLASQVAEKVTQAGQQTASNHSEQHKETNSEEQTAAQADVTSDLSIDTPSISNDRPSVFNQQLNAANTTTHLTDVSTQASKTLEIEDQIGANEAVSKAIVSENNIQTKNNATALNETISIFRKDFAEAVKDKVMVIISQKLQQFDIRLDPPELGSVHVRVNLQNEQAVVNFTVQNQQAKEAFEENLSKLKDMLAEKGVDVGDASVEQQAQNSGESETSSNFNGQNKNDEELELASAETVLSANLFKSSSSNVDYYA